MQDAQDMVECNEVWFYKEAIKFVNYEGSKELDGLNYVMLGLAGEVGELVNKVKKIIRDDNGVLTPKRRAELIGECGDIRWYVAALCYELDMDHYVVSNMHEGIISKLCSPERGDIFLLSMFSHALSSRAGWISSFMVGMVGGKSVAMAHAVGQLCEALECIERTIGTDATIVHQRNIAKLTSRRERGVLGGEGDNR